MVDTTRLQMGEGAWVDHPAFLDEFAEVGGILQQEQCNLGPEASIGGGRAITTTAYPCDPHPFS